MAGFYKYRILLAVLTLGCFFGYSQTNNYIKLNDSLQLSPNACLTNNSNYKLLKATVNDDVEKPDSISIRIEANYKNKSFKTIEDYNRFDLKFWLLINDAFKTNGNFKLTIIEFYGTNPVERNIVKCLVYINPDEKDRGSSNSPDFVTLPVYFGTDRDKTNSKDLNEAFGIKRSKLKYGIVEVSIPHDHRVGEIETPSIWRFEFTEDPAKHIMLQKIAMLEKASFFEKLSKDIKTSKKKSTFLFVHGYNTSFSEAAKRTAQISYDLKFDGKAVFYSWPSQASTFRYGRDEENIVWSRKNIKSFLDDYLSISEAEEIYLVAHSMGNRGLTRAIVDIMAEKPELRSKIKEIILAAPDIDADVFKKEIAPKMVSKTQKPITLYVSADDLALKASKLLHGNPRAGDAGEKMVIINGIETIDATGIDTSFLSHSYFADSNSIIADIFDIIQSGKRAIKRKRLQLVNRNDKSYYKVKL